MQKTEDGSIIIACDFTGVEWDEVIPMIEGHRGSILSLSALALAVESPFEATEEVLGKPGEPGSGIECTMCTKPIKQGQMMWRHPSPPKGANPVAAICWDCVQQADRTFSKDPDTDWDRHIDSSDRWS